MGLNMAFRSTKTAQPVMPERSLTERIHELRAEINAYIDKLADAEAKERPGVPRTVLRNLITGNSDCECRVGLWLLGQQREQLAR